MMLRANSRHHDDGHGGFAGAHGDGLIMKRKILLRIVQPLQLGFLRRESQAWLLQCFHHHKYTTQITCRPYNAFTPICWGNLTCDGCCPSFGCGGNQMPMMMGAPYACAAPMYGNGCVAGNMPNSAPMPPVNNFTPPMPMPVTPGTTMYPYQGVSQANFYPPQAYYPSMPTYYNPYAGYYPAPYYWYAR